MIQSYLAHYPRIHETAYIHPSAQIIGDVNIAQDASVWCNTVLRGDVQAIKIGRGSNIQDLSLGHVTHKSAKNPQGLALLVGDDVTVGHGVILHACTIGNRCLIGMGSLVMDEVVIEDEVMLGAGSLVSPHKRLVSGFLYIGRPAVQVRPLTDEERNFLLYSAQHYVRVKNNYQSN